MDKRVYVGPFLRVGPNRAPATTPGCSRDPQHTVTAGDNFCRTCGAPTKARSTAPLQPCDVPNADLLFTSLEDAPSARNLPAGWAIWLADLDGHRLSGEGNELVSQATLVAADELTKFELRHSALIERIRQEFATEVQVDFGVVTYWS